MSLKPSDNTTAPLQILVVDDNLSAAQTLIWVLEVIGHESRMVHTGLEALETAKQMHPDVILLDIGLPGMNGYDVCRELRKDPIFKDTVIIAQTGWGQERDRREAVEAGFDHHLVKPVGMQELTDVLNVIQNDRAPAPQVSKQTQRT